MVWSPERIVDGDELDFANTGEVLRKGSTKLDRSRAPLDASFLSDGLREEALLLGYTTELGVASIVASLIDTGGRGGVVM